MNPTKEEILLSLAWSNWYLRHYLLSIIVPHLNPPLLCCILLDLRIPSSKCANFTKRASMTSQVKENGESKLNMTLESMSMCYDYSSLGMKIFDYTSDSYCEFVRNQILDHDIKKYRLYARQRASLLTGHQSPSTTKSSENIGYSVRNNIDFRNPPYPGSFMLRESRLDSIFFEQLTEIQESPLNFSTSLYTLLTVHIDDIVYWTHGTSFTNAAVMFQFILHPTGNLSSSCFLNSMSVSGYDLE